ncbi:MAG: cytochrome C [Helicobacteraceae bacterium]|nr:cytochrome C [Helicobacteraceae bacterium]
MNKFILVTLTCSVTLFGAVNVRICKECHGQNFEKHALHASRIISELPKEEISAILIGFKYGTYGPEQSIMRGRVFNYSDEELRTTGIGK